MNEGKEREAGQRGSAGKGMRSDDDGYLEFMSSRRDHCTLRGSA